MTLRDQLKSVLRKHKVTHPVSSHPAYGHSGSNECPDCQKESQILDDLLAAIPQPSREALEKIIREDIGGHHHYTCHIFCKAHWKIMGDKLMAWATGQRERQWCEHCIWDTEGDFKTASDPRYHVPHWCFQEPNMKPTPIRDAWIACPLCAAPRPEER